MDHLPKLGGFGSGVESSRLPGVSVRAGGAKLTKLVFDRSAFRIDVMETSVVLVKFTTKSLSLLW